MHGHDLQWCISSKEWSRRDALTLGGVGLATLSLRSVACHAALGGPLDPELSIGEALVEMIDGELVYAWAFGDPRRGPSVPGPVLEAFAGQELQVTVTNTLSTPHAFAVLGTPIATKPIAPGATETLTFRAPPAGTYLYVDPLSAPVNRLMGLHGAMVVLPEERAGTPYSAPTPAVARLFGDLGTTEHFPGEPWQSDRSRVWLFGSVDLRLPDSISRGATFDMNEFLPGYFTINGLSGAFASHDPETIPKGRLGEPHLVRILNAGMAAHSPHFHANHVYVLARNNVVQENVVLVDSFTVGPTERVDVLLPFMRPPDVAGDPQTPLRDLVKHELGMRLGTPQRPLAYPMHCHMEMSQTAAGGNYPQGLVTHWEITGDLDGVDFPESELESQSTGGDRHDHSSH
ncbi:MAG: multicopper oxidase domain-containing protein [Deltaproteobacteria bacterium]|nr:multicopper oxidase domain-containing protein [Deltaproteobacteria bacterium]